MPAAGRLAQVLPGPWLCPQRAPPEACPFSGHPREAREHLRIWPALGSKPTEIPPQRELVLLKSPDKAFGELQTLVSTVIKHPMLNCSPCCPAHRPQGGTQPCQLPETLPAEVKPSELSHHDSHHYLSASNLPFPLLLWAKQALGGGRCCWGTGPGKHSPWASGL